MMPMIKNILIYIFIIANFSGYGQTVLNDNQKLKFKQYSLTEGLSQSSVLCILQDSKGFMWFGTRDGLNKFDGQKFITYRHNSQDSTSISNSFIRSLIEDEEGNIWVGTMNGLNKYLAKENEFQRFKKDESQNGFSNNEIWAMAATPDGRIWLGTNLGLETIDRKTSKITQIKTPNAKRGDFSNHIRSLVVTSDGQLWICNTENIEVYNPTSKTFKEYKWIISI